MDKRPDPDELLRQAQTEEPGRRGRLKIFFGGCAGVGKTYAMLEAARQQRQKGLDVVVGLVETHGRKETEALVTGLEILPRRAVAYQGTALQEFDLDGALTRQPGLLLLDELAHTNAPGSRHAKRWQDVQELLIAGIDVYTTLNVQHLETMNDVVAQVTGIVVKETVPDAVFEQADEVEVVDLPPDELLSRLAEGKVYLPEQAERAKHHFFKPSNLTALREIALRMTADRVNAQVQRFRLERAAGRTWATTARLLVCIGPGHQALHIIRAAHRMARSLQAPWTGVYVETPAMLRLPEKARQQITQHLRLVEQLGAETVTLSGESFVEEVLAYARSRNVTAIIVGKPKTLRWPLNWMVRSPIDRLIRNSGDIQVYVVRGDPHQRPTETLPVIPSAPRKRAEWEWRPYWLAVRIVALLSFVNVLLLRFLAPVNLLMLYLVGVVTVAWRVGRGPAVLATVLSVLTFDFLFVPPHFTFAVSDTEYLITFGVMLLVSLIISDLTSRLRQQTDASRVRERRTAALYDLSRQLASNSGTDTLLKEAVRHIAEVFESRVVALLPGEQGRLRVRASWPESFTVDGKERGVAQWVYDVGQIAGLGTDTLPACESLYVPMMATGQAVGALGVRPADPSRLLVPDQLHLLEAFAHQAGLALEADRLADERRGAEAQVEAERLRNIILSSIPHDLRTPLAAIGGSAASLVEAGDTLDAGTRKELAQNIADEADRLSGILNNILDLTKLESGTLEFRKVLVPVEDIVGSALSRVERRLAGRPVNTFIEPELPLVLVDELLMQQAIVNLLDNVLKYTPAGSPVDVQARRDGTWVVIEVADRGPGLADDPERLFEKFYRGDREGQEGFGLGLTICRGIVQAHGGRISAENRPGGGAIFRLHLPGAPPAEHG